MDARTLRDHAPPAAAESPESVEGLVHRPQRIALMPGMPQRLFVETQAARPRLAQHPLEREVRQPALVVPAPDVGVHARKPHLLQRLVRRPARFVPEAGRKVAPALVDGQSLVGERGLRAQPRVVPLPPGVEDEGLDGIPHADEVDRARPCEGRAEAGVHLLTAVVAVFLVIELRGVLHEVGGGRAEQAASVQHPGQRANGECAPAEAEQVHPIVVLVRLHEEPVGILDVLPQAVARGLVHGGAQGAGVFLVHPAAGPDTRVVVTALLRTLLGQRVGGDHVGVVGAVLVSGAVAAHDDVLHEIPLQNR